MKNQEEMLDQAIKSMREGEPEAGEISASAEKVAGRLGIAFANDATIESCEDVQPLFGAYRAGTLSENRSLLVKAHLRECGVCLRRFHSGSGAVDWSTPKVMPARTHAVRPWAMGWAMAASLALAAAGTFMYKAYWQVPQGVRAEVQSIDGSASLISDSGSRVLAVGAELKEGDQLRTSGGSHAVLRLSDGSTVELNERSAVSVGARGRNMTLDLDHGAVIVKAAHRTSGHLYVKTDDCSVAVTGTVFSVNSGIKGSRVAVLQGAVDVAHAGMHATVNAGDEFATTQNLAPEPVSEQFSWSTNRDQYVELLAQLSTLQHRIEQIPIPQRYGSDLLDRMPGDTQLYVSIPNLGDFVSQAKTIFEDQLKQSPVLQQWWSSGKQDKTAELDELVNKLHDLSQYLGDEMVIVALKQQKGNGFAVIADVQRSGLSDLLKQQFVSASHGALTVIDESALQNSSSGKPENGAYALVRAKEVVFSNSIDTLKTIDLQLNAGSSGFAGSDFGQRIKSAYSRGAGVILAANLQEMLAGAASHGNKKGDAFLQQSGIADVRYLIAEHRESNGTPQNHLNLQFSGARQRVASWLGSPAPVGSLDFVSPNAALAVAGVSKDPTAIVDDMIAMMSTDKNGEDQLNKVQSELGIDIRNDLAGNLGGEFLFALDGPVLPTPSWKAVIEVRDSARFETTLEKLAQAVNGHLQGKDAHGITIDASQAGGQTFHTVHNASTGVVLAEYTYSNGYMIIAPTRALVMDALHAHSTGDSLGHSASFKALLPVDQNENYSAVAYQNLGPVITPLLSHMSGESADALKKLASDSHPTAICAWGKDAGIEAASNSNLFGFDFLTLGRLLHSDNKQGAVSPEQM